MCKLNTFRDVHVDIQKGQIHIKYLSDVLIDLLPKSKNDESILLVAGPEMFRWVCGSRINYLITIKFPPAWIQTGSNDFPDNITKTRPQAAN